MSKHTMYAGLPLLASLVFACAPAQAEWRCDCTRVTGSCNASVEVKGSWVQVTSDERACARVEYLVDGQPFIALVVDGEHRQEWLTRTQVPAVVVQSCQLCEDRLDDDMSAPATGAMRSRDTPSAAPASPETPLIKVAPVPPPAAQGRAGEVVVEVNVDAAGAVTQARVLEAQPSGVFDQSALDAVRRWRYPQGAARVLKERIVFQAHATGAAPTNAVATGPRNTCVREGAVDELVDIVQVQLINACADPVLVRSCAEGFGERAGKWVCNEPIALVSRGDARNGLLGELATDQGRLRFGYADENYLSRPTGSRYAFIACAENDSGCYGAAMRWTEYLHAKSTAVDPRAGSETEVAVLR